MCSHRTADSAQWRACLTLWQCDSRVKRSRNGGSIYLSDLFSSVFSCCNNSAGLDGLIPLMLKICSMLHMLMCFGWKGTCLRNIVAYVELRAFSPLSKRGWTSWIEASTNKTKHQATFFEYFSWKQGSCWLGANLLFKCWYCHWK